MYIEIVPNRGSRPAYLLRDAWREGSKTIKRTLANLSHLPDHAIEALRLCLKGVRLCDASKTFAVKSTIPCGHVKAMRMAMARLGMAELVSSKPCSERDIVLAMIAQRKMAKHFVIKVQGGNFTFRRDEESIRSEERQDGLYVIRTSESAERLSAAEAVRAYKALGNVEKSFRTFNGVDILVRPIRHWTSDRVRAHIFLCMLTYYVEWHMRRALSTLLYAEDDLPSARTAQIKAHPLLGRCALALELRIREFDKARLLEKRTYSRTMALLRRAKKIRIGEHGEWLPVRTNPSTGKMFAALGLDIAASEQPKRRPGRPPKTGTPA